MFALLLEPVPERTVQESIEKSSNEGSSSFRKTNPLFNSGGHVEYTPFLEDADRPGVVLVDDRWWSTQTKAVADHVVKSLAMQGVTSLLPSPEVAQRITRNESTRTRLTSLETAARYAWQSSFVYEMFNHCLDTPATLVPLAPWEQQTLLRLARTRVQTGRCARPDDLEEFGESTVSLLAACLQKHQSTGMFAKTSFKSAKNDSRPRPLRTALEVLAELTSSRDVLCFLEWALGEESPDSFDAPRGAVSKALSLVLVPWEAKIAKDNEWRAIVQGGLVTGISQQHWGENVGLTRERAERDALAIARLYKERLKSQLPWPDVVLDVWVDHQNDTAHLIECNPGCPWGWSGSSLFHWLHDADKLGSTEGSIHVRWVAAK